MKQKIIADTSIWIEYFKQKPEVVAIIDSALDDGTLYITGMIVSELLQGVKTEKEFDILSKCLNAVPELEAEYEDWVKAGSVAFDLRRKGVTLPLTDIIISVIAMKNNASLYTLYKHFLQIQGLELYGNQ